MASPEAGFKNREPAFVLTCPRSGSTLLRYLIDSHPQVACPPELNLAEICLAVAHTSRVLQSTGDEVGGSAVRALVDGLMTPYLQGRGREIWCDKSLVSAAHAPLLVGVWPEARFVCLYRHCLDVVASGLEASPWGLFAFGFKPYAVSYPANSIAALVACWIDMTSSLLDCERSQALTHRVRYEELVGEPAAVVDGVFDFLGVAPMPDVATIAFSHTHEHGPGDDSIIYTNRVEADAVGLGRSVPIHMIPTDLLAKADELLAELGYLSIKQVFGAVGSLDPKLSRPVSAPQDGRSSARRTLAPQAGELLLVAWSGVRECGRARLPLHAGTLDAGEDAVAVAGQMRVFEGIRSGVLDMVSAVRSGDLRFGTRTGWTTNAPPDSTLRWLAETLGGDYEWGPALTGEHV
ncbi:MAG: sulfotransferase family protein [Solirubrobacteraceae bacterium]